MITILSEIFVGLVIPAIIAFVSCIGFCMIFNIRDKNLVISALGGALAWVVYLVVVHYSDDVFANFMGGIVVSLYAEIIARIRRAPSTCFLIIGLLPLVPGSGIYYTMKYFVQGDMTSFGTKGMSTLINAGAIALGIMLVISMVRMLLHIQQHRRKQASQK